MQITKETLIRNLPEIKSQLQPGKTYDVEIKLHREKRSKDANAFLWSLLGKMAGILKSTNDDI